MGKIVTAILVFFAIVAVGWIWTRETGAEVAYVKAETRISEAAARDLRILKFDDLPALAAVPPEISELSDLVQLSLQDTQVSDVGVVSGLSNLRILNLRGTRIADLAPISNLKGLEILDVGETWISDVSPLVDLPKLTRLDLGGNQLRSLEPATRMSELVWLNLHAAYAVDGSNEYYLALQSAEVALNNGRAFREDYRPDWWQRANVRARRVWEIFGFGQQSNLPDR